MTQKSIRSIGLFTKVSPEEKTAIDQKMKQLGTQNLRAYLRKMAVDGYVIQIDMADIKAICVLLRICANNMNQIAKRTNETRNIYEQDVEDLRKGYDKVWGAVSKLLRSEML